jgi:myo-inositol 2-dehydrogenase/D-chiro-inositol 1-dehydrogenase
MPPLLRCFQRSVQLRVARRFRETPMKEDTVRFGLVGYGLFGAHHAAAIAKTAGAELAAIAVKSEASRRRARETFPHVQVTADYRELVARNDLDVVDVVIPNALHAEVGRAVLEAGKHLLLEKPMAVDLAGCDELLALAQRHKRLLAVNHELRLSSLWGGMKQLVEKGIIGRPQHALIELSRFPYRTGSEGWRYDPQRVGNWILEEPIHFFDLARWYLSSAGEPVSVYARANGRHPQQPELRDNFSAIVNFPGHAYAVVTQTLSAFEHHVTAKIVGTEGTIWAHWSAPDARSEHPTFGLRYGLGDDVSEVAFTRPTGELLELADQIDAMVRAVRDGAPIPCTGADGRWSTLLCLAAEQSVASGKVVRMDTFSRSQAAPPVPASPALPAFPAESDSP